MRVILYTGKGGVGKTTLSAATGVRAAAHGHRTLLLSTDLAHSLGDCLDVELGPDPVAIADRLDAVEVDVGHEIAGHWRRVQEYLAEFLASQGYDELLAEELGIPPGTDELLCLMKVAELEADGGYDLLVVDCAPTAGTLRMLGLADVLEWYMDRFFDLERRFVRLIRPVAERLTNAPLPPEDAYDALDALYGRVRGVRELLVDPERSSVRLVTQPERMVIRESQRAQTYLGLYGFPVDAVVTNRILPPEAGNGFLTGWKRVQERNLEAIDEAFAPLPILRGSLQGDEPIGLTALMALGGEVFGDRDPAEVLHRGPTVEIRAEDGGYEVVLPLPHARKADVRAITRGDELILTVGSVRRNLVVPRAVRGLDVTRASLRDGAFHVRFE